MLPDGEFKNVPKSRSLAMGKIRGKGNATTEKRFRYALVSQGIRGWVLHPKEVIGKPDVYFVKEKIAIFLDGCFWHGCPKCGHIPKTNRKFWHTKILRNMERDKEKARILRKSGIKVVRFWEHKLLEEPSACVEKIRKLLKESG